MPWAVRLAWMLACLAVPLSAQQWPSFRGPNASGIGGRRPPAGFIGCELLRTRVQRGMADGLGGGLDDAGARVRFHQLDHETMQSPLITLSASSTTM